MKEEKKVVSSAISEDQVMLDRNGDPSPVVQVSGQPFQVVPVPFPKNVSVDQTFALRKAIKDKKSFKLVRKVYQGKSGKYFFGYSVIVMVNNKLKCKEIRVLPDSGFVAKGDDIGASKSNSSSYGVLNLMYDFGGGCDLVAREEVYTDKFGNEKSTVNFYAVSGDENGVQQEFPIKAATAGDRAMLISAFTGFGGVRDWTFDDYKSCEELQHLFIGYCAPGTSDQFSNIENA